MLVIGFLHGLALSVQVCSVTSLYCCVCVCDAVNVKKWEDTVAEDERELEKLKKDENKQMKVLLSFLSFVDTVT